MPSEDGVVDDLTTGRSTARHSPLSRESSESADRRAETPVPSPPVQKGMSGAWDRTALAYRRRRRVSTAEAYITPWPSTGEPQPTRSSGRPEREGPTARGQGT